MKWRISLALVTLVFSALVMPHTVFAVQDPDPIFGPERTAQSSQLRLLPNQFDGSYTHNYPLTLSPGRNGVAPQLSLSYSSKNSEQGSIFGHGWTISIPYIERINKRGTNKLYLHDDFFSTLDGELKATTTPGMGGDMSLDAILDGTLALDGDPLGETLDASTTIATTTLPEATSTPEITSIDTLLKGKTKREKADIKAQRIAEIDLVGTYRNERFGVDVEIQYVQKIDGGVRVFAKAWREGEPLGFGDDGTVEIERINVYNPPVLVDDAGGSIVREWTDRETKEIRMRRLREDPAEAMRESIAHTLSVIGKTGTDIEIGKVGNTTSVFYPSQDAEGNLDTGSFNTYSNFRTSAGNALDSTSASKYFASWQTSDTNDARYRYWGRGIFVFDTSSLPDADTIASTTLSLYGTSKANPTEAWSESHAGLQIVGASTAASSIALGDFDIGDFGTTSLASRLNYSDFSTSGYNDILLNASGNAAVNSAGETKLGTLMGHDFDNADPGDGTGGVNVRHSLQGYYVDQTGTANDPKLTVVHSAGSSVASSSVGYGALADNGDFREYQLLDSNRWQVTDKQGTVYKFGTTAGSQIVSVASTTEVYRWMLDEVRDKNGNYVTYEYYKDQGQVYPHKITYTNHASSSGIYEVEFVRETRNDVATSSAPGFSVVTKHRIKEIDIKTNGVPKRVYALGFGTGDNGRRSMLTSITESGVDDSNATTTLPAVQFSYTTKTADWTYDSSWVMPQPFVDDVSSTDVDWGARFDDYNGDGWTDIAWYRDTTSTGRIYLSQGDGTWATTTPTGFSQAFVSSGGEDLGYRTADVDGDGLVDYMGNDSYVSINSGRGSSFSAQGEWLLPSSFNHDVDNDRWDEGGRLVDINGDGLPDFLKAYADSSGNGENGIYLNNGAGWDATSTNPTWTLPNGFYFAGVYTPREGTDFGVRFADFNADGLTDMLRSRNQGSAPYTYIYFNNGDGSWTQRVPTYAGGVFVEASGTDNGYRIVDVNADGLPDIVNTQVSGPVYLNLDGGQTFTLSNAWGDITPDFVSGGLDRGARFVDIDADGIVDIARSYAGTASPAGQNGAYLGNGVVPDLLKTAVTSSGGRITVSYKPSSQYVSGGAEINPLLPLVLQTVETVATDDGFGTYGTTTHTYGGGEYYYTNEFDRTFAGFATSTVTDPLGHVAKSYQHQSNNSLSSIGEYLDSRGKIGKTYRTELSDESGNLFEKRIDRWESATTTNDRVFVKRTRSTEFSYDGDSDHKDRATEYTYNDSIGNLSLKSEYGEVTGSDDGSYTDTGSDTRTTHYSYATSSASHMYAFPQTEIIKNNSGTRVAEKNFYYDSLALGSVDKGNLTKQENWIAGSTYASTTRAYNGYGLVTSETDPRGKTTTISYDSANLFIATSTNPLSHTTEYYRDLTSGKAKKTVDPNSLSFEIIYDGLDRPMSEKIPDHLGTPSNTVTKTEYTYTDTALGKRVRQTNYLNSGTTTVAYTYFDGFDKSLQERRLTESGTTHVVRDIEYDPRGDLKYESLPYFGSGSAWTSATTSSSTQLTYYYDPERRVKGIVNIDGTELHAYDQWKESITDREGNVRHLSTDAYGRLSQVEEVNATSTYTTAYTYDALGNLTKITDAASNLRNFSYDGLSRLTSAEDLHASGDGTFGTRTYAYDLAGNIASTTDAKSQVVEYTYDDLNRALTENYTGEAGTEISYAYDSCTNGKGRLCSATTTAVATQLTYDALGNVATERRTIDSTAYLSTYTRDRLGNITSIVHPNNAETAYLYNIEGALNSALFKHVGSTTFATIISNIDYGPTGQATLREGGNNTLATYTYDLENLYRLSRILTLANASSSSSGSGSNTHALDFEKSSSQYASIGDGSQTGLDIAGDLTLEAWVKLESQPTSSDGLRIVTKWHDGQSNNRAYNLGYYDISGTKKIRFSISDSFANTDHMDFTQTLSNGQWYHIAAVFTATSSNYEIFVDGTSIGSQTGTRTAIGNSAVEFIVGASQENGGVNYHFDGVIDDVRVWGAKRTASQISANKSTELAGTETNLKAYYKFNNSAEDTTSNNNDLTLTNSPVYTVSVPFGAPSTTTSATGTPIQDLRYTYDKVGNITQITDYSTSTGKIVLFGYDDLNRLTSASTTAASSSPYTQTYAYSSIGNITNKSDVGDYTYTDSGYNNPHAASVIGAANQTYDRNGNLLSNGTWNYLWNYRDRLTSATTSAATSSFSYDHANMRVKKIVAGVSTTTYPTDAYNLSSTGTTTVHILLPDGTPVATVESTGNATSTYFTHPDHLGSVHIQSNASSSVISSTDFLPYGAERIRSATVDEQLGYIARDYDREVDLQFLRARYYSADNGRFLNQDPVFLSLGNPNQISQIAGVSQKQLLSDPQQINAYNYARGNPIVNKDPTGNNPLVIAGVAGAVFAVGQQAYMDVNNGQFSGFKVYGTQAVIGGATGVGVALAAVSAPITAAGIGFLGAYSSSVYGDEYNPANATGEIDQTKAVAQGAMNVATMGFGRMIPGIPGSYPKFGTLMNNFQQNPVKASTNFFFSKHAQRDILQQLSSTLGALLVELNRLQDTQKSGSKDATTPSQPQKKTANRRRKKTTGEIAYDPNKKWIWQTFALMLILPTFSLMLTPRSDPMFYALLFAIAMVVVIFTALLRKGSLYLKDGVLAQEDLLSNRLLKVSDIQQIEIVRHGFWGGTYIMTSNSKININHSFFDEETRSDLIEDLQRLNPAIRMKGQ